MAPDSDLPASPEPATVAEIPALGAANEHPYADFIHRVNKPAQYLGGENGEVRKSWDDMSCRMCLAFPDLYEIGMSHLGYKILYGILNEHPKLLAERAYAPWKDMEAELRERDEPLRSLETWRPLSEFDVVGFSLQYELTYTNVLLMLDLGGIPLRSADRGDSDPLVVCGGPVATHAEPLAEFVDVYLIGDGEEKTAELMLTWAALRDAGVPRAKRLEAIALLGGFYVPSLYALEEQDDTGFRVVAGPKDGVDAPFPVQRAIVRDLRKFDFPSGGPVAATETIFDRVSIEIARGCTEGCRFCQAGMIYRPVRERDPQQIIDTIVRAVREGGYDEASLTSLSTADYSAIQPLVHQVMAALKGERVNVSVSSLRAYGLSEAVLDDMKTQRAGGLTFAPEAGTQRMRDVVNKNVTDAQLMETAERIFSRGWSKMKLYFMIGLPTEEDEDVAGIVHTGARAWEVSRKVRNKRDARVTVSVSTHVPKPHTPFQWCAMDEYEEVQRKQALLKSEARTTRVSLRMHDSRGSWLEGVLARGDRRLSDVIEGAYKRGARFDSWDEGLKLDAWDEAFEEAGVNTAMFLGTIPIDARLPWDHIDVALEEGFLAKEYRKAVKGRLSPPCGKVAGAFVHHTNLDDAQDDARKLVCYDCGVACDMGKMRSDRLVYLNALGAKHKRLAPSKVEVAEGMSEKDRVARDIDRQPLKNVDQGPPVRLRIGFAKVGRIAFSSHLDLVRLFPRWFRRADLPVFYSEGYHPKVQMTFSPALGLGVASLGEYVDLKLRSELVDDALHDGLLERLQRFAFEGIEVFGCAFLGDHDRALGRVVDEAHWVAGIPRQVIREQGMTDESVAALVEARAEGPLTVKRIQKGRERTVDVAKALVEVRCGEGAELLQRAGIMGDLFPVRFRTTLDPSGTAKPTEVVTALFGESPVAASGDLVALGAGPREIAPVGASGLSDFHPRLVREGLFAVRDGERVPLLELEALRVLPTAKAPSEQPASESACAEVQPS